MENKLNCETPRKILQNILLEKAVHNKLTHALCNESPFQCIPNTSTPPSGLVKNPFDSLIKKRLHQSMISPSLFRSAITNNKTEVKFKWTIEEISMCKPANIDESIMEQYETIECDPEKESLAQATIDRYFNEKHIVPSPLEAVPTVALISESTSPFKLEESEQIDDFTQTVLTFPPILPDHVEAILKPYFSYTVDQQRESKDTKLYRRLFEFDEAHEVSSVLSSPAPSLNLSPIEFSPLNNMDNPLRHRDFGSDADVLPIADCNISPLSNDEELRYNSPVRSNSSGKMSIDATHNWVPDTLDQIPMENNSLVFDSVHSPVRETLSNSAVNWDMEYRHVSFASPRSVEEQFDPEMDVSRSNTPKTKKSSFNQRQRKKLSDSFLKYEELDDCEYNKENIYPDNKHASRIGNVYSTKDITDAGYHTGNGLTMYEESWSASQIFASTPTSKNKM